MNHEIIRQLAIDNDWDEIAKQPDPYYTRFRKDKAILDVWQTGTVRYIPEPFARAEHFRDAEDITDLFNRT